MQVRVFPECCAGAILCDFGGTPVTSGYTGSHSPEAIKEWLTIRDTDKSYGFYLIAINSTQNKFMASILEEFKYKCVGENIKSPNHPNSKIFIYLKIN